MDLVKEKKLKQTEGQKLRDELCFIYENQWDYTDAETEKAVHEFSKEYAKALDLGKTEREFHDYTIARLEEANFKSLADVDQVKAGDRVYRSVHGKGLMAAVVGEGSMEDGLLIVGSHIDSPRLDLKPYTLFEKNDMTFFKTHYYGGIKKYHWLSTQLAVHGVVFTKDGEKIRINVGEDENDPVFTITDILPHIAKKQKEAKAEELVTAEMLNVLIGSKPHPDKEVKERFKLGLLEILHEKYGITERDLITGELCVVPATKARDVGFDRSFLGAYGHDDRVCAYTSLMALLDAKPSQKTQVILFTDKEEVGCEGNTGAKSSIYFFALNELHAKLLGREPNLFESQRMLENSKMLSSDVTSAYDPDFDELFESLNTAFCNYGVGVSKYTGSGGKVETSDANAEYFNEVTRLFDEHNVPWQAGVLGRIDEGGGGTIALHYANAGMNVLDVGVPLLAMHSCFEICSKLDVYNTYRSYKVFFEYAK